MASRLGSTSRRYLDFNTAVTKGELRSQQMRQVVCGPPYGGYCPDLITPIAQLGDARAANAFIPKGGGLIDDDGFERVDATRLPLGDSTPPAATGFAIVGLFQSYDVSTVSPVRLAMTCSDGDGVTPLAHLYELSSSNGQWTHRAAQNAGRAMSAASTEATLFDYAYFPPAATAAGVVKGATIFTNNLDQIMRYPSVDSATTYDIFDQSVTYKAKSVEVSENRVLAFNVEVAGGRYVTRLIWTNKSAAASFSTANVGAGFADFLDVKGQGLKVMNLGQFVALYFDSAVVVLQRTGNDNDPFKRLYTSNDRGLLSTQAVVQLGSGIHFGLFSDGWFFFDDQTRWEEVGLRSAGGNTFHKWHKTFYELLDWENRHRVVCVYDGVNRLIRIAFPSRGSTRPDTVWNYDLLTDTVWPDSYGAFTPNIWGTWFDLATAGITIDNLPGSMDSLDKTFDEYNPTRGRYRVLHGTTTPSPGLVFKHDPFLSTRDGSPPTCGYTSHLAAVGDGYNQKTAKRLIVGYLKPGVGSPPAITTTIHADSGQTATGLVRQTKGTIAGTPQTDWVSGLVSGVHHGWEISATAPVSITSIELMVSVLGRTLAADE